MAVVKTVLQNSVTHIMWLCLQKHSHNAKKGRVNMYYKEVDMTKRSELVNFLKKHFRYNTMRGWNRSTSYANCVKIHCMDLPKDVQDKAWELICGEYECLDWDCIIEDTFYVFRKETGYACGFNGRSGGYIVLYETGVDNTGKSVVYPGRSIDMYADFDDEEEWDMERLQRRVRLVQKFDQMCDNLRDELIHILRNSDVEEYEVVKTTVHKKLVVNG